MEVFMMIMKKLKRLFTRKRSVKTLNDIIYSNNLVYINEKGHGTGTLYINGKKVYGIKDITINAHTNTNDIHHLELDLNLSSNFRMED